MRIELIFLEALSEFFGIIWDILIFLWTPIKYILILDLFIIIIGFILLTISYFINHLKK